MRALFAQIVVDVDGDARRARALAKREVLAHKLLSLWNPLGTKNRRAGIHGHFQNNGSHQHEPESHAFHLLEACGTA